MFPQLSLQLGVEQQYVDYLVNLALTLVALVLAFYIVFQAFRGYRRNDSRRMLLLAVGLTLLTIVPFGVSILGASVGSALGVGPRLYSFYLPAISRLFEIAGLGVLLYSLLPNH